MKLIGFFIVLLIVISFVIPQPGNDNYKVEVATDSGNSYVFDEIRTDSWLGSLHRDDLDIFTATAEELRDAATPESPIFVAIPTDAKDAACIGASLLDKTFVNWSEAGTVCVYFNELANAWVVFGQMKDRYSTTGSGTVVIGAETGEVLYISFGFPST